MLRFKNPPFCCNKGNNVVVRGGGGGGGLIPGKTYLKEYDLH